MAKTIGKRLAALRMQSVIPWQALERQAKPWQQRLQEAPYNPFVAPGPPPWTGATIAESSAPISPPVCGMTKEERIMKGLERE